MELTVEVGTPSRKWRPAYLEQAAADARSFLNEAQYEHAVQQVLLLCEEDDPTHPRFLDVDALGEFHELRDKYGVLGKINLRIFFWVSREHKTVVVLGAWKKESEGQTPTRIIKRIKWRKQRAERLLEEVSAAAAKALSASKRKG